MREFHTIVECSYNERKSFFVARFLDGSCLSIDIKKIPDKYVVPKMKWTEINIDPDKQSLVIPAGRKKIHIPAHVIHCVGRRL